MLSRIMQIQQLKSFVWTNEGQWCPDARSRGSAMRVSRRQFMAVAGVLSAQALLAACGGGAATNTPAPSSAPASTALAAASAAPSAAPSAAAAASAAPTPARPASPVVVGTPRLNTNVKLTFYNAQHENLVVGMLEGFTKEAGI